MREQELDFFRFVHTTLTRPQEQVEESKVNIEVIKIPQSKRVGGGGGGLRKVDFLQREKRKLEDVVASQQVAEGRRQLSKSPIH